MNDSEEDNWLNPFDDDLCIIDEDESLNSNPVNDPENDGNEDENCLKEDENCLKEDENGLKEGENLIDVNVGDNEGGNFVDVDEMIETVQDSQKDSDIDVKVMKRITELSANDIRELDFCSEEEACEFYSKYARFRGFSPRKDDVYKDSDGNIISRQIVCNRAGQRHQKHMHNGGRTKQPKPITRVCCLARIRFRYVSSSKRWKVVFFCDEHNHPLTPFKHVHLIPKFRQLSEGDKAQADGMNLVGVRTRNIMEVIMGQKGGAETVGFTSKDLSNHLDKEKRKRIKDGDAVAALSYLQGKRDSDPLFFFKYNKSEEGNLLNLLWCDGTSRLDYNVFGDVVAFDSTYKRNKYNRPLVIFCGYNHHKQTTIFAAALVHDEKTETYKWVLETLTEAMFNRHPKVAITDGDKAMKEAIRVVWPNTTHRQCAWHIHQNALKKTRNTDFADEFKLFVYANLNPDRFGEKWDKLIEKHGLTNNEWIEMMYETRASWASTFMQDKFFAGIRTTSLCEGINSFIKNYLHCKCSLLDFLFNFERALKKYRHNELVSDFKSSYGEPVITTALSGIEYGAAKILTRDMFWEVKSQIEDALGINVEREEVSNIVMMKMRKISNRRKEYIVVYEKNQKKFVCDCGYYEYFGIPCSHIIAGMRSEYIDEFPTNLVSKRWLKSAKSAHVYSITEPSIQSQNLKRSYVCRMQLSRRNGMRKG
ncbi:protein FAR1-RELATED SEQUENCE 5-like [Lotus japonicus]|uniref:protein FAR1-RELATED SEQUENCE 5-like n=1 Tax=Lotus japonicus TaxID=34305 RepID=UPI002589ED14|nr:protein FAR1-RELATED SEQUENCE 5-like [Lotus japonicus]